MAAQNNDVESLRLLAQHGANMDFMARKADHLYLKFLKDGKLYQSEQTRLAMVKD